MPGRHHDSRGYYRTLGVSPRASAEEIRLAYEMIGGAENGTGSRHANQVEKAWMVLKNPARRRQYDRGETAGGLDGMKLKLGDPRLLVVCVVLLVGVLAFVWVPLYGSRFRSFAPGDRLVDTSGKPFGAVVRSEERHPFPAGITGEAYLVELDGTKELRWFPANDIRALCRKSRS